MIEHFNVKSSRKGRENDKDTNTSTLLQDCVKPPGHCLSKTIDSSRWAHLLNTQICRSILPDFSWHNLNCFSRDPYTHQRILGEFSDFGERTGIIQCVHDSPSR